MKLKKLVFHLTIKQCVKSSLSEPQKYIKGILNILKKKTKPILAAVPKLD